MAEPRSRVIYCRLSHTVYDALIAESERRAATVGRTAAELLTAVLLGRLSPSVPHDIEAHLTGRALFETLAGFLEAAGKAAPKVIDHE